MPFNPLTSSSRRLGHVFLIRISLLTLNDRHQKDDQTWSDTFKKGRQYFGILLLIFEWGTTWPFYMPPVPIEEIPFHDQIGTVVRVRRFFTCPSCTDDESASRKPSFQQSFGILKRRKRLIPTRRTRLVRCRVRRRLQVQRTLNEQY
jgi:hypothetical protein